MNRLLRLKKRLASKLATNTNPIEIGPQDLAWLIEQAEMAERQQIAIDQIYTAFDDWNRKRRELEDAIMAARSASTMLGTSEK